MRIALVAASLVLVIGCSGSNPGSRDGGTANDSGSAHDGASGHDSSTHDGTSGDGGTPRDGAPADTGSPRDESGGPDGGGPDATGGPDAVSPDGGAPSCTHPSNVLPLNPSNPQDGISLSGYYVDTDTWNAANYPVTQTLYVCDYNNWYVVANMNNDSGDGAVKTYPNVHKDFNDAPRIDSFTTIASTFAHAGPHVGIYEFAYDIWLNGVAGPGSTEVMIWTDNYNQVPSGSVQDTVTFDGLSYDVYKAGSYIAFVVKPNVTSGNLDLLAFFNYLIMKGWIAADSTLGAIDYGVELVSTDGHDATFSVTDFSITTN